jgi:hypothetical protein
MLLSGIYWWDKLLEIIGVVGYRYLATSTTTFYIQISYFSGVRWNKSYFW